MQKEILSSFSQFFLGANTPLGFFSRFDHLCIPEEGWFCYILKGGPGTGKATLMKKLAETAVKKKIKTELIQCASDPRSLDAVIFPELKKCVVDGTAPHVIDPKYPGIADTIVHLGEFWNEKKLRSSGKDIIKLTQENLMYHKKSQNFLAAYNSVEASTTRIILESIDYKKLDAYIARLVKKTIKSKSNIGQGREIIRFISSPTPEGYMFFSSSIQNTSGKNFIIEDEHGIIGSLILKEIKAAALEKKCNIITCYSPFAPKDRVEALFIPELDLGFVAVKSQKELNLEIEYKKITTKKFLNKEALSNSKFLLNFNKKVNNTFLQEAVLYLKYAKSVHDKLENIYTGNMDYKKINKITDNLISAIFYK